VVQCCAHQGSKNAEIIWKDHHDGQVYQLRKGYNLRAQSLVLSARHQSRVETQPAEGDLSEERAARATGDVHEVHKGHEQGKRLTCEA
jgi:hypothetical protein